MKKINLKHKYGSYDIFIGENLIENTGDYIENAGITNKKTKFCIVSDDIVFPLYGVLVKNSIEKKGFAVKYFIFKNGERVKKIYRRLMIYIIFCARINLTEATV